MNNISLVFFAITTITGLYILSLFLNKSTVFKFCIKKQDLKLEKIRKEDIKKQHITLIENFHFGSVSMRNIKAKENL